MGCRVDLGPGQRLPKAGKEGGGVGQMRKTGPLCPRQLHPFSGTKSPLTSPALSLCDEALQRATRPGQARELHLHILPLLTIQPLPNAASAFSFTKLKLPSEYPVLIRLF